jgi:hypothetical protein
MLTRRRLATGADEEARWNALEKIYSRRTALLQMAENEAEPGQTSCARLVGAGCIVPAFAAILRRLARAINGLPNREWEPAPDIGPASTSRFQDLLPPHVDADRTLTGRLGRRTPGIRNLPIYDRQSEPPCIWGPVRCLVIDDGDMMFASQCWPKAGRPSRAVSNCRAATEESGDRPASKPGAGPSGVVLCRYATWGPGGRLITIWPRDHQRRYAHDAARRERGGE